MRKQWVSSKNSMHSMARLRNREEAEFAIYPQRQCTKCGKWLWLPIYHGHKFNQYVTKDADGQSPLNVGLGADGERIFISPRFDGEKGLIARASSGWLLAECVIAGRIANGGHDGTEKGKHCFNLIANAMLDGVELPKIIHYIPPNV